MGEGAELEEKGGEEGRGAELAKKGETKVQADDGEGRAPRTRTATVAETGAEDATIEQAEESRAIEKTKDERTEGTETP